MDYDSRPLYFLNFTYENLKPLICVLWCFCFSNARVSIVHISIYIIIGVNDQFFETSCCFAIPGA